jgi:phosphatidylethanolamine-binding protein (PEBP) family uncharacterized protein
MIKKEVTMRASIFLLIILSFLLGCSEDYSNLPQISVDFKWPEANTYETSPEIRLQNVPDNTKSFKIKMYDLDNRYNHGGGTCANNVSNLIAEGTLKNYEGPYPPGNMRPRYEISVKALDENGDIIAFGKKIRRFPPEPK